MITKQQIKAARALMDLSQTDLGKRAGLSQTAIAHIESGKTQPTRKNLDQIRIALEREGVDFADGGVRPRPEGVEIIRGSGNVHSGMKMMEYTFETLIEAGEKTLMINGIDMTAFKGKHLEQVEDHVARLQEAGMNERILVKEGARLKDLRGPVEWYRAVPDSIFSASTPSFIFAHCFAIMLWDRDEVFVLKNKHVADDQRRTFTYLWDRAKPITS